MSYVVRYDPRGRPVKYNHVAEDEDNNEEEDHDYADQEQVAHVVDVSDEEVEEVDQVMPKAPINRSFLSCFPWVHVTLLRIFGHDETHELQLQG
jgi:K+/H+ antiporter YhaU regulatory subunit KhtT